MYIIACRVNDLMYNNFNVKRFMKTKLIKKKKHDSKKESDEE